VYPSRQAASNARATARGNPSSASPGAWNPTRESLNCSSAIFELTNPAVDSGGVRVIAQDGDAEAGPTARHLDYTPVQTREQLPCVPV
jgi:hypothetical protein